MNTELNNSVSLFDQNNSVSEVPLLKGDKRENNVQNIAEQALSMGEWLSYAKYGKYIPGAPSNSTLTVLTLAGDTCRFINNGMKIKDRVGAILNPSASLDKKIQNAVEVAKLTLDLANTQFVDYLPTPIKNKLEWMSQVCEVAQVGSMLKDQIGKVGQETPNTLSSKKEKLEAARLAVSLAAGTMDLANVKGVKRSAMTVGWCGLTAAKAGVSALNYLVGSKSAAAA